MPDLPDVLVSIEEPLPPVWATEFADSVARPGLRVAIDRPEPRGRQAGPEWLLPTAVSVFLFKSYFDGVFKEAGKDHYQALKPAISRFWSRLFGKDRVVKATVLASAPGKLTAGPRYSLTFSLMAEGTSRRRFKLLLPENVSAEEFEASMEVFLELMQAQHSPDEPDLDTRALIASRDIYGIVLVDYDPSTGLLRTIDYLSSIPSLPNSGEGE